MTAATAPRSAIGTVLRAPFTTRAGREALFCLIGVGFGLAVIAIPLALSGIAFVVGTAARTADKASPQPAVAPGILIVLPILVVATLVVATPIGRRLGVVHRALAARLLGDRIAAPPPVATAGGPMPQIGAVLRDGAGWRAVAYSLLKLPLAVPEGYGVFCYVAGVVNLTYPLWWRLFRNHPPDVRLGAVPIATPFGAFHITTFAGTFAACAAGAAMVLVAPWLARGASRLDRWLMRGLLGPGRLNEQVQQLRVSRARAVDDAAELVRRLERDLHDGAQIRLATLGLNLGMAREKLGADGPPPDLTQARELIAIAHTAAMDALVELRDLVRGIHPPALDNGLPDALSTLITGSAIPVTLTTDLPTRPAAAIETITYFCVTELLANAAKHSRATRIHVDVTEHDNILTISVGDDGVGGADPALGSGLTGLAQRISTVDGRMPIHSPTGGPTRITVDLPLQP